MPEILESIVNRVQKFATMLSLSRFVWVSSLYVALAFGEGELDDSNFPNIHCTTYYDREKTWPAPTSYDDYTVYPPLSVTLTASMN